MTGASGRGCSLFSSCFSCELYLVAADIPANNMSVENSTTHYSAKYRLAALLHRVFYDHRRAEAAVGTDLPGTKARRDVLVDILGGIKNVTTLLKK